MLEEELLAGESVVFWTDEPLCLPRRRLMVIPRWTLISADVIRRGLGGEMDAGFGWLARAERHLLFLDGDWGGFPVGKGLWRIEGRAGRCVYLGCRRRCAISAVEAAEEESARGERTT